MKSGKFMLFIHNTVFKSEIAEPIADPNKTFKIRSLIIIKSVPNNGNCS